jgi:hypothetical protein
MNGWKKENTIGEAKVFKGSQLAKKRNNRLLSLNFKDF